MVVFNPDIGQTPSSDIPDFSGVSRGSIPNRSFEYMFEGAAKVAEGAATAYDQFQKRAIDTEVRAGYDQANKPYDLPQDLINGTYNINALQTAYDQGKISDVYYYGQLTAMTKGLRAKYPGYDDYVDTAIQNITGVRPANAYRNAILTQFEQDKSERERSESQWETWVRQNEEYLPQGYFNNPENYDRDALRQSVANQKRTEHDISAENSRIALLFNQEKLTDQQATETATTTLQQVYTGMFNKVAAEFGRNGDDWMQQIAEGSTSGFTDEQYSQMMAQMQQTKGQIQTSLWKSMTDVIGEGPNGEPISYASILGTDAAKKLVEDTMAQFSPIEDALLNKDYGMVTYYTRMTAVRSDRAMNEILNASPELTYLNAVKGIDQSLLNEYLLNNPNAGNLSTLLPELIARQTTGDDNLSAQAQRIAESNQPSSDKEAAINGLIDNGFTTLLSTATTPDQFLNTVHSMYGLDDTGDYIWQNVNPDDKMELFRRMYRPDITQAIVNSGDRNAIMAYLSSARDRFTSIPELRRASGAIAQVNDWSNLLDIKFNGVTGDIYAVPTDAALNSIPTISGVTLSTNPLDMLNSAGSAFSASQITAVNEGIRSINDMFHVMAPLLDAVGLDDDKKPFVYLEMLKDLNIDIEDANKDGFFSWLGKELKSTIPAVQSALETTSALVNEVNRQQALNSAPTSVDFNLPASTIEQQARNIGVDYYSQVASAESGNSNTAQNPNSSATGKYQFTRGTWFDLMRRYPEAGLTADGRTDEAQQDKAIVLFTEDNKRILDNAGIPATWGNLYAAHFLGAGDAVDVLEAPDDALVSDYVPASVIRANGFLRGMTVAKFKQWAESKFVDRSRQRLLEDNLREEGTLE